MAASTFNVEPMTRQIPPYPALRAFEATVRTGRVIDAADELCVTHAAVSHLSLLKTYVWTAPRSKGESDDRTGIEACSYVSGLLMRLFDRWP